VSYYGYTAKSQYEQWCWKQQESKALESFQFPDTNHLRILSYNIFLRPPFIKNNKDDYKNERYGLRMIIINNQYARISQANETLRYYRSSRNICTRKPSTTTDHQLREINRIPFSHPIRPVDSNVTTSLIPTDLRFSPRNLSMPD
jgi:hypothetical protein